MSNDFESVRELCGKVMKNDNNASEQQEIKVLYTIICASSSAPLAEKLVIQAQADGWDVCVLTTPQGCNFFDLAKFEELTGHPIRSDRCFHDAILAQCSATFPS